MAKKIKVSAPGKIILSGEHAVVYGYPEVLSAIDKRLFVEIEESKAGLSVFPSEGRSYVEHALETVKTKLEVGKLDNLKVVVSSEIPIGCGLGSSAAFAVAITTAFFEFLKLPRNLKKINEIAYGIEKKQHNNPSGGDNTISTYGGFLLYRKETETFKVFSSLKTRVFPSLFLINSGKPIETTGEMVDRVRRFYLRSPLKVEKTFKEVEQVTRGFLKFLSKEESNLGELVKTNEELLERLGVVSKKTMRLIRKVEKIGGFAKISGAGGVKENSGIMIAYHADPEKLISFAEKERLDMFRVKLGEKGVKFGKS